MSVAVPVGFCFLAMVASAIRDRFDEAERQRVEEAERRLTDLEVAAATAMPNPCDGAARLHRFAESHDSLSLDASGEALLEACCDRRITELLASLALAAEGEAAGRRSEAIVAVGGPLERAEEELGTFDRCAAGVLDQVFSAALIERAHEDGAADAWRGYARLLEADDGGDPRVGSLLFPEARRVALARSCIEGGLDAPPNRADPEADLEAWTDLNTCAVRAPAGTSVSASERARITRGLAAAQSRLDADRAREARVAEREARVRDAAERRREAAERREAIRRWNSDPDVREGVHSMLQCMSLCAEEGFDQSTCAGRCSP
jgi:hypothetical protein